MKKLRVLALSMLFALSAASFAFADIANPDPVYRATNGRLSLAGIIAVAAIAFVLGYVYSKRK